jgi:hypothetical protein
MLPLDVMDAEVTTAGRTGRLGVQVTPVRPALLKFGTTTATKLGV